MARTKSSQESIGKDDDGWRVSIDSAEGDLVVGIQLTGECIVSVVRSAVIPNQEERQDDAVVVSIKDSPHRHTVHRRLDMIDALTGVRWEQCVAAKSF